MGAGQVLGFGRAPHAALVAVLALVALALAAQPPPATDLTQIEAARGSLAFVPNGGQTDARVRYMARGPGHAFYFTPRKAVLDFRRGERGVALELRFRGANPAPAIVAERRAPGRANYITGTERHANLARFEQLRYRELWPGIDMVFRGRGGQLKYEFLVRPGADPRDIRLAYAGADSLAVAANGALAIGTPLGTLRDAAPRSVQGGEAVAGRYVVSGSAYGFALGRYDRSRSLVIDPGLVWSSFIGGSDEEHPRALAVDDLGNAYATGFTSSTDFPVTPGAFDVTDQAGYEVFVAKFGPAGGLVYSTYLGGSAGGEFSSGSDQGRGIAVDDQGQAYVMGSTDSLDFPTTPGAFRTTIADGEILTFTTKLNPTGSALVYSTFVGPADTSSGAIAVDGDGSAYVTGGTFASNFPTTAGAYDETFNGGRDVYLAKLNPAGSGLEYSTYIGGAGSGEASYGVAVDAGESAYISGDTGSINFPAGLYPTTLGAYDTTLGSAGSPDAFVTKVNAGGSALVYSTYLGGASNESGNGIDVDGAGNAYVTGPTGSSDFPTTPGAYSTTSGRVFLTKLNATGSGLAYSTFLSGFVAAEVEVDLQGRAYVTGNVNDGSLPTTADAFDTTHNGGDDAYLTVLEPAGNALRYSTYLGGSEGDYATGLGIDDGGSVWVFGRTASPNYPISAGAADPTQVSREGFVTRLDTSPFTGYPRPKGATPARFAMTTAYEQCTDPNEIHGPPLAYGSCAAPQPVSDHLTVGTGDSNGLPARNEGYVRFDAVLGIPSTPADEADVRVEMFMDDVFTQGLTDYGGELRAQFTVRITDRDNAPTGGGPSGPGTTVDVPMGATFPCAPVADPQEGSSCAAATTIDAITPGAVKEGKRAVWALDRVRVFDGGADGDGDTVGDNTLFATAGVFVP